MATETVALAHERPAASRVSAALWAVVRWGTLLVLAAIVVIPVGYAALGGFKDNFQITSDPIGLRPDRSSHGPARESCC